MRFKQKAGYTLVLQYFVINEKKNQPNRFITECHNLQHFAI